MWVFTGYMSSSFVNLKGHIFEMLHLKTTEAQQDCIERINGMQFFSEKFQDVWKWDIFM